MSLFDQAQMIEAARCWADWGECGAPRRNDARVIERFGRKTGTRLLAELKAMEDDFYRSNAHYVAADLNDMAKRCAEDFKRIHPDVAEEIVRVFVRNYTFDYK